jgi:poly(glycerol-phosphate) alpha-glucosyltransferase
LKTSGPQRALRIAHFIGRCGPDSVNGVERMVYDLSCAQAALGHHVARVMLEPNGDVVSKTVVPTALLRLIAPVADLTAFAAGTAVPALLWDELRAWRPDLVHLHSLHVPENIVLGRWLSAAGVPYCITIHGALSQSARSNRRIRKAAFHVLFERAYLNRAALIHALTFEERDAIIASGVRRQIIVAPNGVEIGRWPATRDRSVLLARFPELHDRRVFMFLGRVDRVQKGLDLLLKSFASVPLPNAAIVIVGPDWRSGRAALERLARSLGIEHAVFFHEPVFGSAKADMLAGADVFVHTSRWEGASLAVLEAAAMRKPCLLTRAADPSGILGEGGAAIVTEPEVASVAAALLRLATMDADGLRAIGERGRDIVEQRFSWRTTANTLVAMYRTEVVR